MLWVIVKLNSETINIIRFTVNYKNLPKNKASKIKLPTFIIAEVKCTGWEYIFYQRRKKQNNSIDINYDSITGLKTDYKIFETNKLIALLQNRLDDNLKIIHITPNEIPLSFTDLAEKKVPVIFNKRISFAKNYEPITTFSYAPDSITIRGAESVIKNLEAWYSDSLIHVNLDKSISGNIGIKKIEDKAFVFSDSLINYDLRVDRFTEKNINVTVNAINNSSDKDILLLPKKVDLKFILPLKDYEQISADDFEIVADFNEDAKNGLVKLTVLKHPKGIKQISIYPKTVEYIRY